MTIKKHGGIFGRNPTFNDVEVDGTLTVGGNAVPDASTLLVDGDIGSTVQAYDADTAKLDTAQNWSANQTFNDNVRAYFGNGTALQIYHDGSNSYIRDEGTGDLIVFAANLRFLVAGTGEKFIECFANDRVELYYDHAIKLATTSTGISVTGNVAVPSGNGIDFSATSGTGTSELLSDYEEGLWTPAYEGTISNPTFSSGSANGKYIKIGSQVTITCSIWQVFATAGSGDLIITGLPFTNGSIAVSTGLGYSNDWATNAPQGAYIGVSQDYISLYGQKSTSAQDDIDTPITAAFTGGTAADNWVVFSLTYFTI